MTEKEILQELNNIKIRLPINTYKTMLGQIRAGDLSGVSIGIERLKRKIAKGLMK